MFIIGFRPERTMVGCSVGGRGRSEYPISVLEQNLGC